VNGERFDLPDPILIVGGYGYRNVGDEAILAGLLQRLAGRSLTVVSRSPAETAAMHGVRSIPIWSAAPELRHHRSVVIGGGGLFGRHMGRLGRLLSAYGLLAGVRSRDVALVGIGIDADQAPLGGMMLRTLARRAARIEVRDATSRDVLRSWRVESVVRPDLSSLMPAAPASVGRHLLGLAGIDGSRPVIGLCLTAVDERQGEAVARAVVESVDQLPDVEFLVIPMSQHPFAHRHNDLAFGRGIRGQAPRLRLLEGVHHPAAVLSLFGLLSGAVCMRYHALLFADRAGVPIVPVAYADKCHAWLLEHDQASIEPTPDALTRAIGALPALARTAA